MTSPTVSSIRALAAELIARERWSRGRLADHQRQALTSLVSHAATASPYYRGRLARWSKAADVKLTDLPVLTHATLMSEFDGIVCDPRVRLADLERHVVSANPGALHLGGYRVFVTGGASGARGLFLYSRAEWTLVPANYVRWLTALGLGPGTRLATIGPSNPLHLANRAFADLGTPEPSDMAARCEEATALRLTVATPIDAMVTALNAYQPDIMVMPPSAAARLADEQAAGRLAIHPRTILADRSSTAQPSRFAAPAASALAIPLADRSSTAQPSRFAAPPASALAIPLSTAEVLTDADRARFRAAWGANLYDIYVMTETGLIGAECPQRGGIHISEDLTIVESVDEQHQPVPHGTAGAKVLVTNLTNYAQPLIRYEVPDRITLSPDNCRCGIPFTTIASIEPRDRRDESRRDGPSSTDYSDTPTMALDDLPTVIGNAANPPLKLVKSPRRTP